MKEEGACEESEGKDDNEEGPVVLSLSLVELDITPNISKHKSEYEENEQEKYDDESFLITGELATVRVDKFEIYLKFQAVYL